MLGLQTRVAEHLLCSLIRYCKTTKDYLVCTAVALIPFLLRTDRPNLVRFRPCGGPLTRRRIRTHRRQPKAANVSLCDPVVVLQRLLPCFRDTSKADEEKQGGRQVEVRFDTLSPYRPSHYPSPPRRPPVKHPPHQCQLAATCRARNPSIPFPCHACQATSTLICFCRISHQLTECLFSCFRASGTLSITMTLSCYILYLPPQDPSFLSAVAPVFLSFLSILGFYVLECN